MAKGSFRSTVADPQWVQLFLEGGSYSLCEIDLCLKKGKKRPPFSGSTDKISRLSVADTTLLKTGSFFSVINPLINDCGSCLFVKNDKNSL